MNKILPFLLLGGASLPASLQAEIKLPSIIGSHMVLPQKQSNPIWGGETPGVGT